VAFALNLDEFKLSTDGGARGARWNDRDDGTDKQLDTETPTGLLRRLHRHGLPVAIAIKDIQQLDKIGARDLLTLHPQKWQRDKSDRG
jgi:hypothetical protein